MGRFFLLLFFFIIWSESLDAAKSVSIENQFRLIESSSKDTVFSQEKNTFVYADMLATSTVGSEQVSISHKIYYHRTYTLGLIFVGAVGLLSFFILLLYLYSKDTIYLYYFLFLFFSIIGALINLYSYQWFSWTFQPGHSMAKRSLELVTLLGLFAYCLFTLQLLDVQKQASKLARWITVLAGVNVFYGVVYWFVFPLIADQEALFFIVSRSIILPMSFVAIIWVIFRVRSIFRIYFVIGSIFYFVGAFFAVIRQTIPDLPVNFFYNISATTYFHIGIFLEIVCFALALSHRVLILYKTRQQEEENIRRKVIYERDQAIAEVLSSRMKSNPHFIFNSLNAIKYQIQSKQNTKAIKSLTSYSRFIRMVLDTGSEPVISLVNELNIIEQYLLMESNRYDRVFACSVHIDSEVEPDKIFLPPMILLPFIEQAIWDNLSDDNNNGSELSITVNKEISHYVIIIDYDKRVMHEGSTGKFYPSEADKISNKRIELYNKNHKQMIKCFKKEQKDLQGNILGTSVIMSIEYV